MSEVSTGAVGALMDPAPAAPATPETPAAPTPAQSSGDWTASFNDELKGYVQNKGFKDSAAVLESYRNMEKLIGEKEKIVRVPDRDDDVEGWNAFHKRIGRPEKPEEYKVPFEDKEFGAFAQKTFHELGLSAKQGEALAAKLAEHQNATLSKITEEQTLRYQQDDSALKKEWGAAYEQNVGVARKAVANFGMTASQVDALEKALGYKGVMDFAYNLGKKIGEDQFVGSGQGGGTGFGKLSPAAAQERIQSLMKDPSFGKRYLEGDHAAVEEMNRLHGFARPE